MIVNVNPYTTTFDENSHVMKFSAVATGVMTIKNNVPTPIIEPAAPAPDEEEEEPETPIRRKESRIVRLSMVDGGDEEDVIYEGKCFPLKKRARRADAHSSLPQRKIPRTMRKRRTSLSTLSLTNLVY